MGAQFGRGRRAEALGIRGRAAQHRTQHPFAAGHADAGMQLDAVAVRDRMLGLGVITRAVGTDTNTFCPPFVTTDAQVDRIVDALATALR